MEAFKNKNTFPEPASLLFFSPKHCHYLTGLYVFYCLSPYILLCHMDSTTCHMASTLFNAVLLTTKESGYSINVYFLKEWLLMVD